MAAVCHTNSWLHKHKPSVLSKPSVTEALPKSIQAISKKHEQEIDGRLQQSIYVNQVRADAGMLKDKPKWAPLRDRVHDLLTKPPLEQIIVFMVFVQVAFAIYITDLTAYREDQPDVEEPEWFLICNSAFLLVYVIELCLRFYVYRGNFFENKWHTLDLVVVLIDVCSMTFTIFASTSGIDFSVCRLLRVLRVARAGRILRYFPEIFIMVKSLAGAFRVVLWSFIVLGVLLTTWSLVAVEYIHPLNVKIASEDCKIAYDGVYHAILTLIQTVVAGDSFGFCSMPLMRAHPWTLIYFLAVLGSVGMGLMNLVLSAIVDRAAEVRLQNNELLNLARLHCYVEAKNVILQHCSSDDVNKTGLVSYQTVMDGYDHNVSFQDSCDTLDATRVDLNTVFNMMDEDLCGSVDYTTFADHLLRLKTDNQHSTVVLIKQQLLDMSHKISKALDTIKSNMISIDQYGTKEQRLAMKEIGIGDLVSSEKRCLQLALARDEAILKQISERKQKMLETMRSATKLMKDNGVHLEGLSELLVDLQDENAIVLLARDHESSI